MGKPKITIDNDPTISVTSDNFIASFRPSDSTIQFKTSLNHPVGTYYFATSELQELVEFLNTIIKVKSTPPKTKQSK